ncbi:aspartate-semialdehyde dehydrogenase [Halorubrum aidingense JCM 13560]|uniref:Aspartate-semialdehyde dehydrogenase n=1 Tax=Halorubrum aidingense JCM 13560 TaxID=1230454 RepID=M0PC86_9EURY|nr:aspartate-semialdehyde dehydrogenase [Halorubrum aidingense]EMA67636.1 aspartate-semialdehyde dehydrogenase [Halorubrum aidingense JCM 13560]
MSVRVGILGATGAVGQRFIQLLDDHPTFDLAAVTASADSAGKTYREAAKWRVDTPIPDDVAEMTVVETSPDGIADADVDLLFSSLPSGVAAEVEPAFLEDGYVVSSNSSNDRMAMDVPLTIPEINPDHLDLIEVQRDERGWDGALVKNPNCSTITMVPTLAAIDQFGLESVHVSTLQAVSGAGYSGVTSMEIIDNAIPHIGGEEEKMETESRKLLGEFDGAEVHLHGADVAASCNRIPTLDGHLENVFAEFAEDPSIDDLREAMASFEGAGALPSSPDQLIKVFGDDEPERPQPRLDRTYADGMGIVAGGLQETNAGVKYNCLAHNTIRGAAGASLLNGELLVEEGYV